MDLITKVSASLARIAEDTTSKRYAKTRLVEVTHVRKGTQEFVIFSLILETASSIQIVDIFMKTQNRLLFS